MNNRTVTVVLLASGLILGLFLLNRGAGLGGRPGPSPGQPAEPSTAPSEAVAGDAPALASSSRVAFIDLETVYNSCRQTTAFDVEVEKFKLEAGKKMEPLHKELMKLDERIRILAKDAPDRPDLEAQFRAKQKDYDSAAEPEWRDLNQRSLKTRERIYTTIRACVAKVAKARAFDLVLADIEAPHVILKSETAEAYDAALREYSVKMQRKAVLYGAREVDLTAPVLEAVNAEP